MNNQLSALQKKYNTVLQEFTDQSYKYSQRIRGKMERQIRIVKPDATEDEIDAMIDSPQGGQVFAQSVGSFGWFIWILECLIDLYIHL